MEGGREGGRKGRLTCACDGLGDLAQNLFGDKLVKDKGPPKNFVFGFVARGVDEAGEISIPHLEGREGGREGGRVRYGEWRMREGGKEGGREGGTYRVTIDVEGGKADQAPRTLTVLLSI